MRLSSNKEPEDVSLDMTPMIDIVNMATGIPGGEAGKQQPGNRGWEAVK